MNKNIYLLIALLLPYITLAGVLKGTVKDEKGEPLPFATVYIQGTTVGTAANAEGEYTLALEQGTHKVTAQFMGFQPKVYTATIKGAETVTYDFVLKEQTLQMKDFVVKANAEDPAYAIIRKAIKRRKFHLEQVKSFQSEIYLKGLLGTRKTPKRIMGQKIEKEDLGVDSAGKGILYLCEEEAIYYARGNKERTIIKAVRESGDPNGLGMSKMPPIVTFYENNVNVFQGINPRGFISPISENALLYYKYKYEGEFRENGYVIDKIKVIPRRLYEPLFDGYIYIVEDDWAIYSLDLYVTQKANLEMLDTLRVEQLHLPLKKDTWVIKNQVLYPSIKIFGFDISGYFVTIYNKQDVNGAIPDTIFSDKISSSYMADANKKDSSYWTQNRPVPLNDAEIKDYKEKDSVRIKYEDPKYLDSMRKKRNKFDAMSLLMRGYGFSTKGYKHRFNTNSLLDGFINYNTVEGLNLTPKLWWVHNIDTSQYLTGKLAARYGFANTHFNAIAKVAYSKYNKKWRGRYWSIGIEGGKYIFQFNNQSTVTPLYNTYTTLVLGQNHMKLYERMNGALTYSHSFGNGFSFSVKADYQRRLPVENTIGYTWAKESKLTDNTPAPLKGLGWGQHDAALLSLNIAYRPGYTYTLYPEYKVANSSNMPLFRLQYQKAIAGIANSVADFDKWRFSIEDDMNLKLAGSISYKIAAGGFLNSKYVGLPDMMHLADNQLLLAAPYINSFQLATYYRYSNTQQLYGELHLEYYLKGLLTNKIPLLRQARWYLVTGTNTFFVNANNYYIEAFGGIDNLGYKALRFLRVDFVYSWNNLNQQTYGIRIGLDPTAAIGISNRDKGAEW
ncbi:hypothetical protein CAP35_11995 [Chitinophagaceae bacterium IBVUCB1]|nr:hypothetical protein CAP35_11995 [Chitinophagaceae bacterium IBVUCB1]